MMAAILISAMLDSDTAILDTDTLLSSLGFIEKHSHSNLTLTQSNSIWLKPIHSHLTSWWQPSSILPSWIPTILHKKHSLIFFHSTCWWQPSWILPCWIQTLPSWIQPLLVFPLKLTHLPRLVATIHTKTLHTFILTQLDDGSHLELPSWFWPSWIHSQLSFSWWQTHLTILPRLDSHHFAHKKTSLIHSDSTWWWQPSWYCAMLDSATAILVSDTLLSSLRFTQNHSHSTLTLTQTNLIWFKLIHSHSNWMMAAILNSVILGLGQFAHKKTSLFHSDTTWWWQPSWILPSWIQTLPSWIQTPCYLLSDSLKNTLTPLWPCLKLI